MLARRKVEFPRRTVPPARVLAAGIAARSATSGGRGADDLEVVVAAVDARAEHLDVRAVDVDRDRDLAPRRRDRVNVAVGRDQGLDVAARGEHRARRPEPARAARLDKLEALLALDAAVDAHDAPRDVVVDGGALAGPPHERDHGQPAARRDVEEVLAVGL